MPETTGFSGQPKQGSGIMLNYAVFGDGHNKSLTRYHQVWLLPAAASGGSDPERWVWKKEGLICQTSEAPEIRFLPQAHPLVKEEVFFTIV